MHECVCKVTVERTYAREVLAGHQQHLPTLLLIGAGVEALVGHLAREEYPLSADGGVLHGFVGDEAGMVDAKGCLQGLIFVGPVEVLDVIRSGHGPDNELLGVIDTPILVHPFHSISAAIELSLPSLIAIHSILAS